MYSYYHCVKACVCVEASSHNFYGFYAVLINALIYILSQPLMWNTLKVELDYYLGYIQ